MIEGGRLEKDLHKRVGIDSLSTEIFQQNHSFCKDELCAKE
jgi:hypothetical protein